MLLGAGGRADYRQASVRGKKKYLAGARGWYPGHCCAYSPAWLTNFVFR